MARTDNLTNFLTDVAISIRNKKGIVGKIPAANFDTEISSIEVGNLKIKTGTFTAGDYSRVNIEHKCGKLPLIVWTECPQEIQSQGHNNIAGFFWISNSLCGTISLNINGIENAGYPYLSWREDKNTYSYTVNVDDKYIYLNPAQKWVKATYTWHAIYEV